MPPQATSTRTGYVSGEFLTRTFRISGEAPLHGEPLLDLLNDHNALFITLERMFISPLLDPAVLSGHFRAGEVRKDVLGLVVLARQRDGLPAREGRYVGRDYAEHAVMLVVAGFEVRGVITMHRTVNIPNFVRTTPERFIPIFNATATYATKRDVVFQGGAILVNRAWIEVFAMQAAAGNARPA